MRKHGKCIIESYVSELYIDPLKSQTFRVGDIVMANYVLITRFASKKVKQSKFYTGFWTSILSVSSILYQVPFLMPRYKL